jgi:hypothetical protein
VEWQRDGTGHPASDWSGDLPPDGTGHPALDGTGHPALDGTDDGADYGALLRSAEALLDDVDRALAELAEGSYGRCAVCGAPIDDIVLAQDPTAQGCAQHPAPNVSR